MAVKTYDPKQISTIVGVLPVTGFSDGDMVSVEFNEDLWTLMVGADGESTRSKSSNSSGKFTLTLLSSSDSNDYLSGLYAADKLTGRGTFPVLVKDNFGRSLFSAATAWISKLPNAAFAKESGTREWVIETDELIAFIGGNG